MKKFIAWIVAAMVAVAGAGAEIAQIHFKVAESEDGFTVNYTVLPGMEEIAFPEQEDMVVSRAFKVKSHGSEGILTYSLFADTGTTEESYKQEAYIWTLLCSLNITGSTPQTFPRPTPFDDADVKGEFNGDFGTNNFLRGVSSDFAQGHKYMFIESFFKRGQGIVIRTFMADDFAFFGWGSDGAFLTMDAPFFDFYDTFRFHD